MSNKSQQEQATLLDLAGKKLSLEEIERIMHKRISDTDTYEEGKASAKAEVAELLLDRCRQGDTRAIIFYLKCHGWVEGKNVDITSSDGSLLNDNGISALIEQIKCNNIS